MARFVKESWSRNLDAPARAQIPWAFGVQVQQPRQAMMPPPHQPGPPPDQLEILPPREPGLPPYQARMIPPNPPGLIQPQQIGPLPVDGHQNLVAVINPVPIGILTMLPVVWAVQPGNPP